MKRLWFGIVLLLLFFVIGVAAAKMLQTSQKAITRVLDAASVHALSGELSQGAQLAAHAAEQWKTNWHWVAAIASHNPMDEIDSLFARLPAYAANQQNGDFAAGCAQLSRLITAIADAHSFSWWNLL